MGKVSDAEKMRNYRKKHSEEYKRKNRERMARKREQERLSREGSSKKQEEYRVKKRVQMREYRQRKAEASVSAYVSSTPSTSRGTYRTPQSFGKAVRKASSALPKSPSKRKAVITKLALDAGLSLFPEQTKASDDVSENKIKVKEFYTRPDISYTTPGMKEEMIVWKGGVKHKERKYYLTLSLKECYKIFTEDNPDQSIGFSTFCKLRPQNVLLLHQTPADQCKCQTCENFFLKLKALKITYNDNFWTTCLCNTQRNSNCWKGACISCSSGTKISSVVKNSAEEITYKEWEKVQNKLTCSIKQGCVGEILEQLQNTFTGVIKHINTKRIQHACYLNDKQNDLKRVLHIDFAMNYSCEYQNEIQSALWSRNSVTLFTAIYTYKGKHESFLICSNTNKKEKNTIFHFISTLYELISPSPEEVPDLEEVIWSDGPSSEFKNRYMGYVLKTLSTKFKKIFTWKYFATSHGKGPVDGIGGRAKSLVRTQVMSQSPTAPIVKNAEDFAKVAQKVLPNVKVVYIPDENIIRNDEMWDQAIQIPNIKSMHVIKATPENDLKVYINGNEEENDNAPYIN